MRDDAVLGRALPLDRGLGQYEGIIEFFNYRTSNTDKSLAGS